jgi:hypothetical protein
VIDAQRQSKSGIEKKMLAKLRTQDDHYLRYRPPLQVLIAAAVLIQIVAPQKSPYLR